MKNQYQLQRFYSERRKDSYQLGMAGVLAERIRESDYNVAVAIQICKLEPNRIKFRMLRHVDDMKRMDMLIRTYQYF